MMRWLPLRGDSSATRICRPEGHLQVVVSSKSSVSDWLTTYTRRAATALVASGSCKHLRSKQNDPIELRAFLN